MTKGQVASAGAALAVVWVVAVAMHSVGSPAAERLRRFDARRVEDLRRIARSVDRYHTRHGQLPVSIEAVVETTQGLPRSTSLLHPDNVRDPDTGLLYPYRTVGETRFEICATFSQTSPDETILRRYGTFWSHSGGGHCYLFDTRTIDKSLRVER